MSRSLTTLREGDGSMSEAKSFLATVKAEIIHAFAAEYDQLAEICNDEEKLGESLRATQKKIWEVVEQRLKESFLNGKKAGGGKPDEERKPNPFRK
jgi:hypothetical protein